MRCTMKFFYMLTLAFGLLSGCTAGDNSKDEVNQSVAAETDVPSADDSDTVETDVAPEQTEFAPGEEWSPLPAQVSTTPGNGIVPLEAGRYLVHGGYGIDEPRLGDAMLVGYVYDSAGAELAVIGMEPSYFYGDTNPLKGDVNQDGQVDLLFPGAIENLGTYEFTSGYLTLLGPITGPVIILGATDFTPSPAAVGVLARNLVTADSVSETYLQNGVVADLNSDGEDELVATDWQGVIWLITADGNYQSIEPPVLGGQVNVSIADFNSNGVNDLLVNNSSEDIGAGTVTMQAPRIFWGPIDPQNPPAWDAGQKFWPDGNPYDPEYFLPQAVIGPLPSEDGIGCWLASGYTWVTPTGVNTALGRMCAVDDWVPQRLVVAPSGVNPTLDARNTIVLGGVIMTVLDGSGPMGPPYARRGNGVFTWQLSDLLAP